jgi:maltose alpha-D-glucosyltransferase/alpha-amylase
MQRLGQRLAELHIALASDPLDPRFAPESFTPLYQRSLYQSLRARVLQTLDTLSRQSSLFPPAQQAQAREVLAQRGAMLSQVQAILTQRIGGQRIRCHGDFQLGHLLFTGKDFVIGSLEGDPSLPLSERRIKRSPLDDVACLLTSVDVVARRVLADVASAGGPTPGALRHSDVPLASRWLQWWLDQVQGAILAAYENHPGLVPLLPENPQGRQLLLGVFRLELALQDLDLVLREEPERLSAALESVLHLVRGRGQATGGA